MSAERAVATERARSSAPRRPTLRSVPTGANRMPRAPFVVLVLLVLGVGLIGLLLLNTALQQGSFELEELQAETAELRDRQTTLAERVAERSAPDALAEQARRLGMVPADDPVFLELGAAGSAGSTGASGAEASGGGN
ncbi:septum formation initiator [Haloactinopolyspora alba]|uniref:Septum formation initiator n=1 Tax=Haloactinopolyspora alba TaxID=648780 RepID=A0A2P8E433_9ACTN|nr:septum formation initiator family protein [Haloactinopolyspora alba]PSL04229.1 septum formation initiator [Haloactinopolyspora alba]